MDHITDEFARRYGTRIDTRSPIVRAFAREAEITREQALGILTDNHHRFDTREVTALSRALDEVTPRRELIAG